MVISCLILLTYHAYSFKSSGKIILHDVAKREVCYNVLCFMNRR
jgi:hypothetical protein